MSVRLFNDKYIDAADAYRTLVHDKGPLAKRSSSAVMTHPNMDDFGPLIYQTLSSATPEQITKLINQVIAKEASMRQSKNYAPGIQGHHPHSYGVLHALTKGSSTRFAMDVYGNLHNMGARIGGHPDTIVPLSKDRHRNIAHYNPLTGKMDFKFLQDDALTIRDADPKERAENYQSNLGLFQENMTDRAYNSPAEAELRELFQKNEKDYHPNQFKDFANMSTLAESIQDNGKIKYGDVLQIGNNPRISSPGNNH